MIRREILSLSRTVGVKTEADAEFLILDGDGAQAGRDRDGEFAASQKTGLLAAGGDQIGLGQNPSQALLFQEVKKGGPE